MREDLQGTWYPVIPTIIVPGPFLALGRTILSRLVKNCAVNPWIGSFGITWELVRNVESQSHLQTC